MSRHLPRLLSFSVGFVLAFLVACGAPRPGPCASGACDGCCDASGACVSGTVVQACGALGDQCQACAAHERCQAGACERLPGEGQDAGLAQDPDAGRQADGGASDAGPANDAGPTDAGTPDAGASVDGGAGDGGAGDAGGDAGPADAGATDGGPFDAGADDAGPADAGLPDAGLDGGVDSGVDSGVDAGVDAGRDAGSPVDAGVSFATQVWPVFQTYCAGCHIAGASGGLSLAQAVAYQNLVGQPSNCLASLPRIDPGSPGTSLLYLKITNAAAKCGSSMPFGQTPLVGQDAAAVALINAWILEGARDN